MDIDAEHSWHGQLQLSGVGKPISVNGSVKEIMLGFLRQLMQMSPRSISTGREINIIIRDSPFGDAKETREFQKLVAEVESGLDQSLVRDSRPLDGESYETYYQRLRDEGLNHFSAEYFANDWFDKEPNQRLTMWLQDSKAAQFRRLNSNNAAYESAMPSEYESLKQYVLDEFPEFCEALVFRTA